MSTTKLRVGISTCPNDTFAFHAILNREIDTDGFEFEFELLDVEELNEGMAAGRFDVAKMSFHSMLLLSDELRLLPAGAALGFGVGPVVLARAGYGAEKPTAPRVLTPGKGTTATLLWKLFHPSEGTLEHVLFSEIMPALQSAKADLGICIHEGRFTWQESGLELAEDLGARWESETQAPLPLGGIAARHELGRDVAKRLGAVVRSSVRWAQENRARCLSTMAKYAVEHSDEVLWSHVDLYVNPWTEDLGAVGLDAIEKLNKLAAQSGLTKGTGLEVAPST